MSRRNRDKKITRKVAIPAKKGLPSGKKIMLATIGIALVAVMVWLPTVNMADAPVVTVYKSATCGCCKKWASHLEDAGFTVVTRNREDMNQIKDSYNVEYKLRSCHTATVDGYVVEGHVPVKDIQQLLKDKPAVIGLAVPGMPAGSPGMEGRHQDRYDVIVFDKDKKNEIYARY